MTRYIRAAHPRNYPPNTSRNTTYRSYPHVTVGFSGYEDYTLGNSGHVDKINQAIDAVASAGGGIVEVLGGTVEVDAVINAREGVTLQGAGRGVTIFDSSEWNQNVVIITSDSPGLADFTFRDFSMIGRFTPSISGYASAGQRGIGISRARRIVTTGVYFEGFLDATVFGKKQSDPFDDQLGPLNIQEVVFDTNFIYDCVGGLQGFAWDRVVWSKNSFEKIGDDAIAFLGATNSAPHATSAVLIGNHMKNGRPTNSLGYVGPGIFAKVDGGGNGPETLTKLIMMGNTVLDVYSAVYLANCSEIEIVDNQIEQTYISSIYGIGNAKKLMISFNQITNPNTSASGSHAAVQLAGGAGTASDDVDISHNQVYGTNTGQKQGFNLEGSYENIKIKDNLLKDCNGHSAIYAETATRIDVCGNTIDGDAARAITVSGVDAHINDNTINGTFSVAKIAGTVTGTKIVRDNIGYVTANKGTGTIASGDTTAVITHGLDRTPVAADIHIMPTENPTTEVGSIFITSISATQFTVNVENAPSTSGLDFGWKAEVL